MKKLWFIFLWCILGPYNWRDWMKNTTSLDTLNKAVTICLVKKWQFEMRLKELRGAIRSGK